MENPLDAASDLQERVDSHLEWLLVRENGRTFPLQKNEIEISGDNARLLFGVIDDAGMRVSRVLSVTSEGDELALELSAQFGRPDETVRLVPRTPAKELSRAVELARLEKANEAAKIIAPGTANAKVKRVALNTENGRIAQIDLEQAGKPYAAITDVTATLTAEALLASAVVCLRDLQRRRKKPPAEMWIAAEKKQARPIRKLHALLTDREKARFKIFEITRKDGDAKLNELKAHRITDLWREKAKKLVLPPDVEPSETAKRIIGVAPGEIDVIFSKHGETLRFRGLPFARVRAMMGQEKAWFGVERNRRPLTEENWKEFAAFVEELGEHRRAGAANPRHQLYRLAPEAWLESILRRNIRLLDANLILSPLYNQFRTSSDKIDLLALRKDGRLVIVELKTSPDREMIFQSADYWRKIELQRRKGELKRARVFGDLEILDKPALVYAVAPALSFHRDFAEFAAMLSKDIELWRFELHANWRNNVKVLARRDHRI